MKSRGIAGVFGEVQGIGQKMQVDDKREGKGSGEICG